MEGILAIIFIFGGAALVGVSFSPLGRAMADRLRHGVQPAPGIGDDDGVWEELDRLRAEVAEVQERLDFAERLLGQGSAEKEGGA